MTKTRIDAIELLQCAAELRIAPSKDQDGFTEFAVVNAASHLDIPFNKAVWQLAWRARMKAAKRNEFRINELGVILEAVALLETGRVR